MKNQSNRIKKIVLLFLLTFSVSLTFAQEKETSTSDLEKQIQNPVASIVSIPFQFNWDQYSGTNHATLNVQPVLPFSLGKGGNIISRTIIPTTTMPNPNTPDWSGGKMKGIGNIVQAFFWTPAKAGKFIWAVGPTFNFPTVTANMGTEKFAIAPAIFALYQNNGWSFGGIFENFWGVAGNSAAPDFNLFYTQVFITKSFKSKWYINTAPIITANWEAEKSKRWTVPLGLGIGKLSMVNKLPVNWKVSWYGYVEHPAGAHSQVQFQMTFILPTLYKGTK